MRAILPTRRHTSQTPSLSGNGSAVDRAADRVGLAALLTVARFLGRHAALEAIRAERPMASDEKEYWL